jgi:hypothetical protein
MAIDKKISELSLAGGLTGDEEFAVNQGGTTVKLTLDSVKAYSQPSVVLTTVKVTVTSAEILDSFGTPIELIAAPPGGYAINVLNCIKKDNFVTVAYTSVNDSFIAYNSVFVDIFQPDITFTQSGFNRIGFSGSGIESGRSVIFYTENANPTLGDSTIDFYITYQVVQI